MKARCDLCALGCNGRPLHSRGPVLSVSSPGQWAIVGEYPGKGDFGSNGVIKTPYSGNEGLTLNRVLDELGYARTRFSVHYALACRPPEGDLRKALVKWRKTNRQRVLKGQEALPHPIDCCKPRLMDELGGADCVVTMGSTALTSLTGLTGIMKHQGCLTETEGLRIVPTFSPSFILRAPRWRPIFSKALHRAVRWFSGENLWTDPEILVNPNATDAMDFMRQLEREKFACYDTETDGIEPLLCNLRTIQFGNAKKVMVVALRSVEDEQRSFYAPNMQDELWSVLRWGFLESKIKWIGHNAGKYDRMVMEEAFWRAGREPLLGDVQRLLEPRETPRLAVDSLLMHRVADPELPHSLGFVGGYYSDVHNWKADHTAVMARTDAELWRYGAIDVAVNARIVPPLAERVREKQQQTVMDWDDKMVNVCVGMHRIGIGIDQTVAFNHRTRLWDLEQRYEQLTMQRLVEMGRLAQTGYHSRGTKKGQPLFNPRSTEQVSELLFEKWELLPPEGLKASEVYTETGARSTSDAILRAHLADNRLSDTQRDVIDAIRRCKRARKARATFVDSLLLGVGHLWGPPDQRMGANLQWPPPKREIWHSGDVRHEDPRLCVWPDGRLRVSWNAHVTTVGRLSCGGMPSRYNLQTVPAALRDMFVPAPGHVFVGADLDQVHLRIIASRWNVRNLLEDFRLGRDPHATFAATVFGDRFTGADGYPEPGGKFKGMAKALRNLGKTLRYTGAYGASVSTIYKTMTRAEDDKGRLLNRNLRQRDVQAMYSQWMEEEPEWADGWSSEMQSYRVNSFLESPLLRRRCDFADGDAASDLTTKVNNYCTLSGEADVMVPMTAEIAERIPWGYAGPNTGLVGQFHDAFLIECPEHDANRVRGVLQDVMNTKIAGWSVPITAEAEIGTRWSDV